MDQELQKLMDMANGIEQKLEKLSEAKANDDKQKAELEKKIQALGDEQKKIGQKMLELQQRSMVHQRSGEKHQGLGDRLINSDGYKAYLSGQTRSVKLEAASPVLTPSGAVTPDNRGLRTAPELPNSVSDSFIEVPTTSNSLQYLQEKSFVNNAAEVAEGAQKPESKVEFEEKDAPVRTIAHFIRITKQLAEDAPALAAYINHRMEYFLDRRVETQLISGDGKGQNLSGIFTEGNYVPHGFTRDNVPADDTNLDLICRCATTINTLGYQANTLYINPIDFCTLRVMKDKNGQYLMGSPLQSNENIRPWGLTPCVSSVIPQGKFMVADSSMGATKFMRQNTTLEMFEQDADNVQKNLITIRAEKRMAFTVDSVNCFVGGDLAIGAAAASSTNGQESA